MRKTAYLACFLIGLFALSFPLMAVFSVSNPYVTQPITITYYLNAGGTVPKSVCSNSDSYPVVGSLDSSSPSANSAALNGTASVWNTFCTAAPLSIGTLVNITSVDLNLFVCCGNTKTPYKLLPKLIDNSTSPPTVLAVSGGFIDVSVKGTSCGTPTKTAVNVPINNSIQPALIPGHNLALLFQFGGVPDATICTGSNSTQDTLSSIVISGTEAVTTTSSSTTSSTTSSSTTTTSSTTTSKTSTTTTTFSTTSSETTTTTTSTTTTHTTSSSTDTSSSVSTTSSTSSSESTSLSTNTTSSFSSEASSSNSTSLTSSSNATSLPSITNSTSSDNSTTTTSSSSGWTFPTDTSTTTTQTQTTQAILGVDTSLLAVLGVVVIIIASSVIALGGRKP